MITCFFEDGDKTSLRHVTVNALVINKNQILLCKRGSFNGKPILESGKWGLIGGFADRDETLEQCIRREIMEESGYIVRDLLLFRINDNPNRPKEDRQNIDIVFIATGPTKIKDIKTEEVLELKWFDLNNLPKSEDIAFDHEENIILYKKYLKENIKLPIIWSSYLSKLPPSTTT